MKRYINSIGALAVALCIGGAAFTSCSDPEDVQDLVLARVLSPIGVKSYVTNNTDIVVYWDLGKDASSYEVQAYADSPDYDQREPDKTVTTTGEQVTLTSLIGETDYYIRVRALDDNNSERNSKWVEIKQATNPEQNMNKVKAGDIQSTSVTVTWTPGIEVENAICTPQDGSEDVVTSAITADEKAAGKKTITGLKPETKYDVRIKLGKKTRGYATITTNLDFTGATVLSPSDDWATAIQNAPAGSKIALAPGKYEMPDAALKISNNVIIGAQDSGNQPILNTRIQLSNAAALTLYQVILDGENTPSSQAITYNESGDYGDLTVKGCEIRNYAKGLIFGSDKIVVTVKSINIDNSIIHDIVCSGGDFIDFRVGGWKSLDLTNSTIYDSAADRDILRANDKNAVLPSLTSSTTVDRCTFYNVGTSASASKRIFYVTTASNSSKFTNNIVVNYKLKNGFANDKATGDVSFSNNFYLNCLNLTSLADGNTNTPKVFDTTGTVLTESPFKDAGNYDFTITDDRLKSYQFGDPRWY